MFKKKPYVIKVENDSVFCTWKKDITAWSEKELEQYLPQLREAVRKTVDNKIWELITIESGRSEIKDYQKYVERVRQEVISRFEVHESKVKVGYYHGDMLVLSLEVEDPKSYPYYFMGIQLKPYKKHKDN